MIIRAVLFILGVALALSQAAQAATATRFKHIVLVVQENRTPDNLFQGLCSPSNKCSVTPGVGQYNIKTDNWLDKSSPGGTRHPLPFPLGVAWDLSHSTIGFTTLCDKDVVADKCRMDGQADTPCIKGTCTADNRFAYVDNSTGTVQPYLDLAHEYGFGNRFFATQQSYSYPAHLFLFSGTAATSQAQDHAGVFLNGGKGGPTQTPDADGYFAVGCEGVVSIPQKGPIGTIQPDVLPCAEYKTLTDYLEAKNVSWRYYGNAGGGGIQPMPGGLWMAPDSINHICGAVIPGPPVGCAGADYTKHVEFGSNQILLDASAPQCKLPRMSWVIPAGSNSDHNGSPATTGGPSWVSSIVNAIGNSTCKNLDGSSYWDTTAIIITWDDWGGLYDHEPPTLMSGLQDGFQLGFRVPLIVVSAYTPAGFISNQREDFGSILRFVEQNFGIQEGILTFADARSTTDLLEYFPNYGSVPRGFPLLDIHTQVASLENNISLPSLARFLPRPFEFIRSKWDIDYFLTGQPPSDEPPDSE